LVGVDDLRITLPSEVVSRLSLPLDALINNGAMEESNARCVELANVTIETFLSFSEFAYMGQYQYSTHPLDKGPM